MTAGSAQREIALLREAIASLEARRGRLGDAAVDIAIATLRDKLDALTEAPTPTQRKLATVLFSDLVSFTPLAQSLDPEDVREVLESYFGPWRQAISHGGGRLEKYIGDAIMAVFGVPLATEADPENAIRAALTVRDRLDELNTRLEQRFGIRLAMRIGIHTGTVLAAEARGAGDLAITGDTVNLSSRLEGQAPPGGILISHDTYRHVRGVFDVEVQDLLTVKGRSEPVQTYLVLRARPRPFHRGLRGVQGIETRMIGREAELQQLQDALNTVVDERQRLVVTVIGEAGIGKSRLLFEFENWADVLPQRFFLFKGRASHDRQGLPYGLVRDLFAFRFQIQDNDPPPVVRGKLEEGFGEALGHDGQSSPQARVVGRLLGFGFSGSGGPLEAPDDARQIRDRALVYMTGYMRALTQQQPVVVLLEDLHWADDSSLDLLASLAQSLVDQPLLIVGLARPGLLQRRPDWGKDRPFYRRIQLEPLSAPDCRRLVQEILRRAGHIPESLRDLVTDKAEGNPFYVEELIKMLIEDGVILTGHEGWHIEPVRLRTVPVPPTLVGVLQARLDRLAVEERTVLQQASVVGRRFWDQAVVHLGESAAELPGKIPRLAPDGVAQALAAIQAREIIFRRASSAFVGTEEYIFKHALLHEMTYDSVLKSVRRTYHASAAEWLIKQGGERAREYAGLIADHLEAAGDTSKAIPHLRAAGEQAAARFANAEAVTYFGRALDLTPMSQHNDRYALLLAREQVYDVQGARQAQGGDLDELERLAYVLGDAHKQAEVALHRAGYASMLGDFAGALTAAQEAIRLAQSVQDLGQEAAGHRHWGRALWHQGALAEARPRLEQALALARQVPSRWEEAETLRALGVVCAQQGDERAALAYFKGALNLCTQLGDRRGEGMCLNNLGILHRVLGDYDAAFDCAERSLSIRRAIGDRRGQAIALNTLGLIHRHRGNYLQAAVCYRDSVQLARELGDRWTEGRTVGNLGNAYNDLGDYASAKKYAEDGLRLAIEIKDRHAQVVSTGGLAVISYRALQSRQPGEPGGGEGYAEAAEYSQKALRISQEIGDPDQAAQLRVTVAHCQLALGNLAESRSGFERALGVWQELGHEHRFIEPLAGLAQIALEEGDFGQAQKTAEQLLEHLPAGLQGGTEHDLWAHLVCYRVFRATGDPRAADVLHSAYALLQDRAGLIDDPTLRRTFLENIRVHRELAHEHALAAQAPAPDETAETV